MKLRAFAVFAMLVGPKCFFRILREYHELRAQLATLQRQYRQVPAEIRRRIERQGEEPYQLPDDRASRLLSTSVGEITLQAASGYHRGTAIFVFFPSGFKLSKELAACFTKLTDGEFQLDPAPGSSNGGNDNADAIISAGLDHSAYLAGDQGYFKNSSAPRLDMAAAALEFAIEQLQAAAA